MSKLPSLQRRGGAPKGKPDRAQPQEMARRGGRSHRTVARERPPQLRFQRSVPSFVRRGLLLSLLLSLLLLNYRPRAFSPAFSFRQATGPPLPETSPRFASPHGQSCPTLPGAFHQRGWPVTAAPPLAPRTIAALAYRLAGCCEHVR